MQGKGGGGGLKKEVGGGGGKTYREVAQVRSRAFGFVRNLASLHPAGCTPSSARVFEKGSPAHGEIREAYEANETWRAAWDTRISPRLGLTRPWRTDNNESREAKAKYCTREQPSTNGGGRVPLSRVNFAPV